MKKLLGDRHRTKLDKHETHILHLLEDNAEKVSDRSSIDTIGLLAHDVALEKKA